MEVRHRYNSLLPRGWLLYMCVSLLCVVVLMCMGVVLSKGLGQSRDLTHVYELSATPKYLSEDVALAKAIETMAAEGYDMRSWAAALDGRTTSPDGRADRYLARNGINPNRGTIVFRRNMGGQYEERAVAIELSESHLSCRVLQPR